MQAPTFVKVKVQPLSAEAFRPYGQVIEPQHPVYPEVDDGSIAVMMVRLKFKHLPLDRLAFHASYSQTYAPLQGSLVLVVAPPPKNLADDPADYEIDYDRVAAFLIEPGQAILINRGVGHKAITVGEECKFETVTRKHKGGLDPVIAMSEGRGEKAAGKFGVVEVVEFGSRDGKLIDVVF